MYSLAKCLCRPYTMLLLTMMVALAVFWWKKTVPRKRLLWVAVPVLLLVVLSMPAVAFLALGTLEWSYSPTTADPEAEDIIVVLTGGMYSPDSIRLCAELDENSLKRCQEAAELYHRGKARLVLVTGGKVQADTPGPPCSEVMRDYLLQLGVEPTDLLVENKSRTTYENALGCRDLLESRSYQRAFLVTDATHMPRSRAVFQRAGIKVVPAACFHRATEFRWGISPFLPSSQALNRVETVAHEWTGLVWYWLHGRI